MAIPVILPDIFAGETNWDEWEDHFRNVATVNVWGEAEKLNWLKVRLTGRPSSDCQRKTTTALQRCYVSDSSHQARGRAIKRNCRPEERNGTDLGRLRRLPTSPL